MTGASEQRGDGRPVKGRCGTCDWPTDRLPCAYCTAVARQDQGTDDGKHRDLSAPGKGLCSCGAKPAPAEHIPTWRARHLAGEPERPPVAHREATTARWCDDCVRYHVAGQHRRPAADPRRALAADIEAGVGEVLLRELRQRLTALADELDAEKDSFGYQVRNGLKPSPGDRIRAALGRQEPWT